MSYFEFRQWIESCFPWWAPFAIPLAVSVTVIVFSTLERIRRK